MGARRRLAVGTACCASRGATLPSQLSRPGWRNGRRGGLKIRCPQGCGGSSPPPGILKTQAARLGVKRTPADLVSSTAELLVASAATRPVAREASADYAVTDDWQLGLTVGARADLPTPSCPVAVSRSVPHRF